MGEVPLTRVAGTEVALRSISTRGDALTVHLVAKATPAHDHLLADYEARFHAWGAVGHGEPPEQPAVSLFSRLAVRLTDDAQTAYTLDQRAIGGSGREWQADWRFRPAPPPSARTVFVEVTGGDVSPITTTVPINTPQPPLS